MNFRRIATGSFLLGLLAMLSACVVAPAPRDGYYDTHRHRYYHERAWHDCVEYDVHCR